MAGRPTELEFMAAEKVIRYLTTGVTRTAAEARRVVGPRGPKGSHARLTALADAIADRTEKP